ncbi:MAG: hypothetical protein AB7D02_00265 [Candidatus Paceibacterota bacterium]
MNPDILIFIKDYFLNIFHRFFLFLSQYQIYLLYFKIIALILSFFFLIGIIIYIKKLKIILKLYNRYLNIFGLTTDFLATRRCQKQWKEIKKLLEEPYDSSWKLAVLKAFSLTKKTLELLGYPLDFNETLKKLSKEGYHNLQVIEQLNQTVEKIINFKDFSLKKEEAEKIVGVYQKFFQEILHFLS